MSYRIVDNKRAGATGKPLVVHYVSALGVRGSSTAADRVEAGRTVMANTAPGPDWAALPVACFAHWMTGRLEARSVTSGYLDNFKVRMKHFTDHYEDAALADITSKSLRAFRRTIAEKLAAPTVMGTCHSVGQLFREAVEVGVLETAPSASAFASMTRQFDRRPVVWPTEEEQHALRAGARTILEKFAVGVFLDAGLRPDEARELKATDVIGNYLDIKRLSDRYGRAAAPRNSARIRPVPLTPELAAIIASIDPKPNETLNLAAGGFRSHHCLENAIFKVQRRLGMTSGQDSVGCNKPKYTPLMLRHACIMNWYREGLDPYSILLLSGISSVTSLRQNYSRLFISEDDISSIDLVDETLSPPSIPPGADDGLDASAVDGDAPEIAPDEDVDLPLSLGSDDADDDADSIVQRHQDIPPNHEGF